ncbi:MAG: hypothetical protein KGN84_05135, partial [Acidobacteriota bacterium]|nr:hypothetical protein [Acidobacteriota bacterium]
PPPPPPPPPQLEAPQVPLPPPKKSTVPDYPDPRTFYIGIWGWQPIPGNGPDIIGGALALGYSTLNHLGKDHLTPGLELAIPITRTGELHVEGFQSKGDGTQIAAVATGPFGTSLNAGDFVSTSYKVTSAKIYLDDLLFPYKFPVSKFRLKSLWEVQWVGVKGVIDAPLAPQFDSSNNPITTSAAGSRTIITPTFGLAAEYAIAPHVLLRAAGSGFGLPHRAELWDAEGTVSYRRKAWELRAGYKIMHFKTNPQKDEYIQGTIDGGFVGLRYHWQ